MAGEIKPKPQVLIVEDDLTICDLTAKIISDLSSMEPTCITSGEHAVQVSDTKKLEVILNGYPNAGNGWD